MTIETADLNAEAIKAAGFYIKKKFDGAPLEAKHTAINAYAHGFYAGVKWREKQDLQQAEKPVEGFGPNGEYL